MGFAPQQVGAMSLWQFTACATGYSDAHNPEADKPSAPSDEDFQAFMEGRT